MSKDFLLSNKDEFVFINNLVDIDEIGLNDASYFEFLKTNAGFFFNKSLLIYPFLSSKHYPSIRLVNDTLNSLYGVFFNGLASFAQDIFGNQFCFDKKSKSVVIFNIEDARTTYMARDFEEWIDVLIDDYDFYTGFSYIKRWLVSNELEIDQRLCPKIPFIVGGDYKIENFYASTFPAFFALNADIAKQVHDLPDGTKITYQIKI